MAVAKSVRPVWRCHRRNNTTTRDGGTERESPRRVCLATSWARDLARSRDDHARLQYSQEQHLASLNFENLRKESSHQTPTRPDVAKCAPRVSCSLHVGDFFAQFHRGIRSTPIIGNDALGLHPPGPCSCAASPAAPWQRTQRRARGLMKRRCRRTHNTPSRPVPRRPSAWPAREPMDSCFGASNMLCCVSALDALCHLLVPFLPMTFKLILTCAQVRQKDAQPNQRTLRLKQRQAH